MESRRRLLSIKQFLYPPHAPSVKDYAKLLDEIWVAWRRCRAAGCPVPRSAWVREAMPLNPPRRVLCFYVVQEEKGRRDARNVSCLIKDDWLRAGKGHYLAYSSQTRSSSWIDARRCCTSPGVNPDSSAVAMVHRSGSLYYVCMIWQKIWYLYSTPSIFCL